ncbi:MAG: hypothetical protein ACTSVV_13695 [Promethearchaeota archaeon]
MEKKNEKEISDDDLDDLLDQAWEQQGLIHRKCKMKERYKQDIFKR